MKRGTYSFEVNANGDLLDMGVNVDRLRRLWLDRTMISANDLCPGDAGDFDYGAWHVGCHLVAAGGVRLRSAQKQVLEERRSIKKRVFVQIFNKTALEKEFLDCSR